MGNSRQLKASSLPPGPRQPKLHVEAEPQPLTSPSPWSPFLAVFGLFTRPLGPHADPAPA